MQEDLIGAVIGFWVPLPLAYIRSLNASLLKNCNCSLKPKIIRPLTDLIGGMRYDACSATNHNTPRALRMR